MDYIRSFNCALFIQRSRQAIFTSRTDGSDASCKLACYNCIWRNSIGTFVSISKNKCLWYIIVKFIYGRGNHNSYDRRNKHIIACGRAYYGMGDRIYP